MKDIFNIKRFARLLGKDLTERAHIIFKVCSILSLLLIAFWLTVLLTKADSPVSSGARMVYLYTSAFITALFAPFALYKNYNHRKKGVDYTTLPASAAEKFTTMFIISLFVMPFAVFAAILGADTLITTLNPSVFDGYIFTDPKFLNFSGSSVSDIVIVPLFCFFGNLLYRNNKILKTSLTIAAVYILIILIIVQLLFIFKEQLELLKLSNSQMQLTVDFDSLKAMYKNNHFDGLPLVKYTILTLDLMFSYIFPAGLIAGAYYRMKNIQY